MEAACVVRGREISEVLGMLNEDKVSGFGEDRGREDH